MLSITRKIASLLFISALFAATGSAGSVYDYTLKSIDGVATPLSSYQGRVVLVVNVASRCGYTPQYAGLESLYEQNKDQGLVIAGIPANNFMSQEPGTNAEIIARFEPAVTPGDPALTSAVKAALR